MPDDMAQSPPSLGYEIDLVNRSEFYLRMLAIFHFVVAAVTAIPCAFCPGIYLFTGIMMIVGATNPDGTVIREPYAGWTFSILFGALLLVLWTASFCMVLSGFALLHRRKYRLCLFTACLSCLIIPLGTILGIFTLVILSRPAAKSLFLR